MKDRSTLLHLANVAGVDERKFYEERDEISLFRKMKRLIRYGWKYTRLALARTNVFSSDTTVKTFFENHIIIPLEDYDVASIYFNKILPYNEIGLIKYMINHVRTNEIFYDVGANYGFYSLLVSNLISNGEIHTFEPNPETFNYLTRSFEENKNHNCNVLHNNVGLTNGLKKIELYEPIEKKHSGTCSIIKEVAYKYPTQYRTIRVEGTTLDHYIQKHKSPTFIKMDAEGAESQIILGGINLLISKHPAIVMEVWSGEHGISFSFNAIAKLYELGYQSYQLNDQGEKLPFNRSDLDRHLHSNEIKNILFE